MSLTRRSFLAAGLASLAVAGTSAQAKRLSSRKVIVIGAGMAGLSAAKAAKQAGAEVLVLEARNRLGGRIWTNRDLGSPVDLGAAWIHGPLGNPIRSLARRVGAARFVTDFDSARAYKASGQAYSEQELERAYSRFSWLEDRVYDIADQGMSLAQAIQQLDPAALQDPLLRTLINASQEFTAAASIQDQAADPWQGLGGFLGQDVVFPNGYDQVFDALTPGLDIRLGQVVSRISMTSQGVTVEADGKVFQADHCIITLPIGVLKAGDVRIEPRLPARQVAAIKSIGAGVANKIALKFDETFWDEDEFIYHAQGDNRFPMFMNTEAYQPGSKILLNFMLGKFAVTSEAMGDKQLQLMLEQRLQTIYPSKYRRAQQALITRWGSDPFARCSYSYATPTTSIADFKAFERPVGKALFFAGEHTVFDHRSSVHGAYISGQRAVKRLLKAF